MLVSFSQIFAWNYPVKEISPIFVSNFKLDTRTNCLFFQMCWDNTINTDFCPYLIFLPHLILDAIIFFFLLFCLFNIFSGNSYAKSWMYPCSELFYYPTHVSVLHFLYSVKWLTQWWFLKRYTSQDGVK